MQTTSQSEIITEQTDIEVNSITISENTPTSSTNNDTAEKSERKIKLIIEDAEISITVLSTGFIDDGTHIVKKNFMRHTAEILKCLGKAQLYLL